MRVLHLTDTHLGIDRWFRGAPRGWRRSDDHLDALGLALAPAFRGEVDLVVHTGDLFDRSRPPAHAMAAAADLLAEVAAVVPLVVMPGNHDRRGLRTHLPAPPRGLHVVDTPTRLDVAGVRLGLVPYLPDAPGWATAAREACHGGVDLLLAHQAFDGVRVPGHVFRAGSQPDTIGPRHLPPGVATILCGHIHPRQAVRVGDALVVHPGSTERTAFSERAETKGVVRWDLSASVEWRFEDLPSRPMCVVRALEDLADLVPGALVRLVEPSVELERAALERGAFVVPWADPAASRQVPLFG